MVKEPTTVRDLPDTSPSAGATDGRPLPGPAFVVAWCLDEPRRTGEAVILPAGNPGRWSVLGRGGGSPDDPHPRLHLARPRPGQVVAAEPLGSLRLSRVQLRARARGDDAIEVERIGLLPLLHDGRPMDEAGPGLLRAGETLQIGRELLLLVVKRPPLLP